MIRRELSIRKEHVASFCREYIDFNPTEAFQQTRLAEIASSSRGERVCWAWTLWNRFRRKSDSFRLLSGVSGEVEHRGWVKWCNEDAVYSGIDLDAGFQNTVAVCLLLSVSSSCDSSDSFSRSPSGSA